MRCLKPTFLIAAAMMLFPPAALLATEVSQKPNIVLIYADDVGYGDVGCYGATKVKTPQIDRLAREGRRFTDAHSASAVCTPSRYALLTGEYPFRINQWAPVFYKSPLIVDPEKTTIADILKRAGYATACIGKWHLGFGEEGPDWNHDLKPGPLELGFDYYFGLPVVSSHAPYVLVENHRVLDLDPADPLTFGPRGKAYAKPHEEKQQIGLFRGGRAAHALYKDKELGTTLTRKAVGWIREHRGEPFFLYFATPQIHHPFTPHPRFVGTSGCGRYGDFLHELDWMVGEVLATLDELKLADNTLVIFTSDNGGMLNLGGQDAWKSGHRLNGELLGFKFDAWEGGHRIPFVARWPGRIPPGSVSDQLIANVDMLATLAAITGQTLGEQEGPDSIDIAPALTGVPKTPCRDHLVLAPWKPENLALRSGQFLYIGSQGGGGFIGAEPGVAGRYLGGPAALKFAGEANSDIENGRFKPDAPREQLYDLQADPSQIRNIVREHPVVAKRLKDQLQQIRENKGDHPRQLNTEPTIERKRAGSAQRTPVGQADGNKKKPFQLESTTWRAILAPADGVDRTEWLDAMRRWRQWQRKKLGYDDSAYRDKDTQWIRRDFYQNLMMVEDRYFYDPVAGKYTVDRYLDDLERRIGGIDSVILWAVYPNIGIDNRNQNDLLHDMPGGLDALKTVVADFHRRGVRVFLPLMPWDIGTRPKSAPNWRMLLDDIRAVDADGVFGDTFRGMSAELKTQLNDAGRTLALQPELQSPDLVFAASNIKSWGHWPLEPLKPSVSKYKWFEPRHQVHLCQRWKTDRTDQLQSAFFNGIGHTAWENIWSVWNQFTQRDGEALRRIRAIQHALNRLMASPDWEPYAPTMRESDYVFASKFPGTGRIVWTLVNRGEKTIDGDLLQVDHESGAKYFDLWNGIELKPETDGKTATLSFEIEGRGYGAVLAVENGKPSEEVRKLLARAAEWSKVKLNDLSAEWKPLPQKIVAIEGTKPARVAPEGMVPIPAGKFHFRVSGVEIEGEDRPGVDVQYPWEDYPRRHHDKELDIAAFFIDKYPVTNAQFKQFLDAAGYHPKDDHNFLRDWKDGIYPTGWAKKPVTWVSIEDARAYAAWAGKRLPREWEWQYAAQGTDGRPFPWGNNPDAAAMPKPDDGCELRGPSDVDAHPRGASPFGVMDMMGNVWQWTDEFHDERTRSAVLRGGGYYRPAGSRWYFPRNTRLDQHGKYLLMAPSRDRSGMIGFCCVVDR